MNPYVPAFGRWRVDRSNRLQHPSRFESPWLIYRGSPKQLGRKRQDAWRGFDAKQPFDLGRAPLVRATVFKLGAEEHVLLLNLHHIAFDGWSWGVFAKELTVLYTAFLNGKPSPLPELSIQYADFAVWQRAWLQGEVLQAQLEYWKERLRGSLPVLDLPTDHVRPGLQTFNGSTVSLMLSPKLTEGLKTLSRREGVTLFVTLLAAFQVLLQRYTGQEDLLVGTPIANRNRAEIEGLIGLFMNTLVMRSDLSGDPTFRELLGRVQETALSAYAHQDLPFEELVEELNPPRDMGRSPIFQVLLSLLNTPMQPLQLPGLALHRMKADSGTSKFDLSLYAIEVPEGLRCVFEYNTSLFDADRIERMGGHFKVLLEGILARPEQRLSELPLLPEQEKHRLLVEWNQTQADLSPGQCIDDLLAVQVKRAAGNEAVAGPSLTQPTKPVVSWTYAELNQKAEELARYLQTLGVGPDVLVAVCMERTVEMVAGLLAVLKAGGAYVPLDPAYPPERLAFILEETRVPVVLTQQSLAATLPSSAARLVSLDDPNLPTELGKIAGKDARILSRPRDPSQLAYVIYTSGSTGKPKGVEICHRAVVNFLTSMRRVPGVDPQGCVVVGHDSVFRYLRSGNLAAADDGGEGCDRAGASDEGWEGVGRADQKEWGDGDASHTLHMAVAPGVGLGRQSASENSLWRRSVAGGVGGAIVAEVCFAVEHVRSHGDDDLVGGERGDEGEAGLDRTSHCQHAILCRG